MLKPNNVILTTITDTDDQSVTFNMYISGSDGRAVLSGTALNRAIEVRMTCYSTIDNMQSYNT